MTASTNDFTKRIDEIEDKLQSVEQSLVTLRADLEQIRERGGRRR